MSYSRRFGFRAFGRAEPRAAPGLAHDFNPAGRKQPLHAVAADSRGHHIAAHFRHGRGRPRGPAIVVIFQASHDDRPTISIDLKSHPYPPSAVRTIGVLVRRPAGAELRVNPRLDREYSPYPVPLAGRPAHRRTALAPHLLRSLHRDGRAPGAPMSSNFAPSGEWARLRLLRYRNGGPLAEHIEVRFCLQVGLSSRASSGSIAYLPSIRAYAAGWCSGGHRG